MTAWVPYQTLIYLAEDRLSSNHLVWQLVPVERIFQMRSSLPRYAITSSVKARSIYQIRRCHHDDRSLVAHCIGRIFLTVSERYLDTPKFLAKMMIVGVLTVNGCLLHWKVVPIVERHIPSYLPHKSECMCASRLMFACGAISIVSWTFALALGSMRDYRGDLVVILTLYFCTLCGGILISQWRRRYLLLTVKNTHSHEVLPPGDYTPLAKKQLSRDHHTFGGDPLADTLFAQFTSIAR